LISSSNVDQNAILVKIYHHDAGLNFITCWCMYIPGSNDSLEYSILQIKEKEMQNLALPTNTSSYFRSDESNSRFDALALEK